MSTALTGARLRALRALGLAGDPDALAAWREAVAGALVGGVTLRAAALALGVTHATLAAWVRADEALTAAVTIRTRGRPWPAKVAGE